MYRYFWILTAFFFLGACKTGKQLAFFQDLNPDVQKQDIRIAADDPLRLQAGDQVQIIVSSATPEAALPFNLLGVSVTGGINNASQVIQSVYTISSSGEITLPGIGDIKIAGLSTEEAKAAIKKEVIEYLKDAAISVTLVNFRITIMGEVARPATYPVAGEKINLLEALGMAGDITIYGKRNAVKVFRKGKDKMEVGTLNINKTDVMRSPFYNLRQNDVVLVEPLKRKGLQAEGLSIFIPAATSIISLIIVAFSRIR